MDHSQNSYILELQESDCYLTTGGYVYAPEDIGGLNVIHVANCEGVVPKGNWLLLDWLKKYNNLPIKHLQLSLEHHGGLQMSAFTVSCVDGASIIGDTNTEEDYYIISDELFEEGLKILDCSGKFTLEGERTESPLEVLSLNYLADEESSDLQISKAWNTLVLIFDNVMDYEM